MGSALRHGQLQLEDLVLQPFSDYMEMLDASWILGVTHGRLWVQCHYQGKKSMRVLQVFSISSEHCICKVWSPQIQRAELGLLLHCYFRL